MTVGWDCLPDALQGHACLWKRCGQWSGKTCPLNALQCPDAVHLSAHADLPRHGVFDILQGLVGSTCFVRHEVTEVCCADCSLPCCRFQAFGPRKFARNSDTCPVRNVLAAAISRCFTMHAHSRQAHALQGQPREGAAESGAMTCQCSLLALHLSGQQRCWGGYALLTYILLILVNRFWSIVFLLIWVLALQIMFRRLPCCRSKQGHPT